MTGILFPYCMEEAKIFQNPAKIQAVLFVGLLRSGTMSIFLLQFLTGIQQIVCIFQLLFPKIQIVALIFLIFSQALGKRVAASKFFLFLCFSELFHRPLRGILDSLQKLGQIYSASQATLLLTSVEVLLE